MDALGAGAYDIAAMPPSELRPPSSPAVCYARAGSHLVLALFACAPAEPARTPAPTTEVAAPAPPAESTVPTAPQSSASPATPGTASEPREVPKDARGKDEIQAVIAANRAKMRSCYDAALKNNPGIAGDLVVSFVINPDGSVKSAEVNWSESELHVPELDSCAVDVLRTLKFPPSSRGLESKVNYPFNFNPGKP
jgi:TonB family protein